MGYQSSWIPEVRDIALCLELAFLWQCNLVAEIKSNSKSNRMTFSAHFLFYVLIYFLPSNIASFLYYSNLISRLRNFKIRTNCLVTYLKKYYWASGLWMFKGVTVHFSRPTLMYFTLVYVSVYITAAYCSTPNPPVNGSVHSQTGTKLGSTLRFSCDQGFRLIGQSSATCTRTPQGIYQWNAPVPLCQGGLNLFIQNNFVLIPRLCIYLFIFI